MEEGGGGRLSTVEIFIQIHQTTVDYCSKKKIHHLNHMINI